MGRPKKQIAGTSSSQKIEKAYFISPKSGGLYSMVTLFVQGDKIIDRHEDAPSLRLSKAGAIFDELTMGEI